MRNTLNIDKLAYLVKAKRGANGLRAASQEITEHHGEVSPSTLSRVENGRMPDMETFLRICDWLQVPAAQLIEGEPARAVAEMSTLESVTLQIRADKSLDAKTAIALAQVIRAVYGASNETQ